MSSRGELIEGARWRLDRIVSRGTGAVVLALVAFVVALILFGAALRQTVAAEGVDDSIWSVFSRLVDIGSLQEDTTWDERLVSVGFVLLGIVCLSLVIALVVTALHGSIDRVRNGSAPLRRVPDLVVLGWSDQVYTLLREFATVQDGRSAVVLSQQPRAWMDHQIAKECADVLDRLAIECRTADRADPRELQRFELAGVSRVVIFCEPGDRDDAEVVKSIFSTVTAGPDALSQSIIAEVCGNAVARSLAAVFGARVIVMNSNELLAFVLAQCVREQGMGQLVDQIMTYRGGEFYGHALPDELAGRTFGEVAWRLENVAPVGYTRGDAVSVLPAMSTPMRAGDRLIVIDREVQEPLVSPASAEVPAVARFGDPEPSQWSIQDIAIVGWNHIVARAVTHLRGFLAEGSHMTVIADRSCMSEGEVASLEACAAADRVIWADTTPDLIATIQAQPGDAFDAMAIVPYRDQLTPSQSDATTLLVLAAARSSVTGDRTRIVSELRESRSAGLTTLVRPDDLLLSDSVTASLIAQVADRPWMDGVLADLFDYHGAALFIHAPEGRLDGLPAETVSFLDIRRTLLFRGELAIGVRLGTDVVLNPPERAPLVRAAITGVIVVGAGVGWNTGNTRSRVADLIA